MNNQNSMIFNKVLSAIKRGVILLIIPFALFASCVERDSNEKIPVIIVTDLGRDVDDMEAIAYSVFSERIDPLLIIHNSNPDENESRLFRSFLKSCNTDAPFISLSGNIEETLTKEQNDLIRDIFLKHPSNLHIAILSQPTVISNFLQNNTDLKIDNLSILVQAYPYITSDGILLADNNSYNTRLDMESTQRLYDLSDRVRFTFIGKHAAYQKRLKKEDLLNLTPSQTVNQLIWEEAKAGVERFAEADSSIYFRIFDINSSLTVKQALERQVYYSNPYDLLTIMAIDNPDYFNFDTISRHRIAGHYPDKEWLNHNLVKEGE